jgi:DNA-binding MarR family transcriptional regulator
MITRDADLTRLLDRLENRGFVRRDRQTTDRRVVHILITEEGLQLLSGLDSTVLKMNQAVFGAFERDNLNELIEFLEKTCGQIDLQGKEDPHPSPPPEYQGRGKKGIAQAKDLLT